MVNVVLDLNCIRLKYMLEAINYNKVWSCYLVGSNIHKGRNYNIYPFFHKKSLEFQEVLFGVHISLNTNSQKLNNYHRFYKKDHSKIIFNLSLILILILKSFVNTRPGHEIDRLTIFILLEFFPGPTAFHCSCYHWNHTKCTRI